MFENGGLVCYENSGKDLQYYDINKHVFWVNE